VVTDVPDAGDRGDRGGDDDPSRETTDLDGRSSSAGTDGGDDDPGRETTDLDGRGSSAGTDGGRAGDADVVVVTDVDGFWFAVYDRAVDVADRAIGATAPGGGQRLEVTAEALASALASVRRISEHARGAAAQLIAADLGVPELAARLAGRVVATFPVGHEELAGLGAQTGRVIGALSRSPGDHRPPVGHVWFTDWDDLVLGTRGSG
jgi:hypothetical protein